MDPTAQILAMQAGRTQQLVNIAIIKKSHEMDMALVNMIDQAARSAPAPAGTGLVVDRRA